VGEEEENGYGWSQHGNVHDGLRNGWGFVQQSIAKLVLDGRDIFNLLNRWGKREMLGGEKTSDAWI